MTNRVLRNAVQGLYLEDEGFDGHQPPAMRDQGWAQAPGAAADLGDQAT